MKVDAEQRTDTKPPSPLANAYLFAGMGAVVVLGVSMMQSTGQWALVPMLIGAAGLVFRWRSAPLLMLGFVAVGQLGPTWLSAMYGYRRHTPLSAELGVCAGILAYIVCQYRLIALSTSTFPRDPRHRREKPVLRASCPQPSRELTATLLTVAVASVAAFFLWELTEEVPRPWNIPNPADWRIGLIAWLLVGGLAVTSAVIALMGWRRMSRVEAALFLQDALWHETRREQRRINRWRAWALRR